MTRTLDDERLHKRSKDFVDFTDELRTIIRDSALDAPSREELLSTSAQWRLSARNIERSARLPMSLAIFGPSQCGKSYLVNELVRGSSDILEIKLPDETRYDYLDQINPPGGRESTAQVTRFTTVAARPPDPDFPFHIRLLTPTDLVKIFVNGFAHECQYKGSDIDPETLAEAVLRADPERSDGPGFSDIEIYDIERYVRNELGDFSYINRLANTRFWDTLKDRDRIATLPDQVRLLTWLWGRNEALSRLFARCLSALIKIQSEDLWVETGALVPRETGILDAQNLRSNLRHCNDKSVLVMYRQGSKGKLPMSLLGALTAEVCLYVDDAACFDFLRECDVLDFPGARARGAGFTPDALEHEATGDETDPLCEVFLRGKIGYLFDRYTELRDISGLVLCSPPGGAPEANSLPHLAQRWINLTQGETPAERGGKPTTLYAVFTKFDLTLVQARGQSADDPSRWDARLKTAFEDFYGQSGGDWTVRWNGGPFTNCFWVRNPNVDQVAFNRANGSEVIKPEYEDVLPIMERTHNENQYVRRYFRDPEQAWAAVATPDKNGLQRLVDSMTQGLKAEHKRTILHADMNRLKREMDTYMQSWLDPSPGEKARGQARKCTEALGKQARWFGEVLQSMCIEEEHIEPLYREVASMALDIGESDSPRDAGTMDYAEEFDETSILFGSASISLTDAGETTDTAVEQTGDEQAYSPAADHFAKTVLAHWEQQLKEVCEDKRLHTRSRLPESWYRTVTTELLRGGRQTYDLKSRIALAAATPLAQAAPQSAARAQAMVAATTINNFVNFLGREPTEASTALNQAPRVETNGIPGRKFMINWLRSLEELFLRNSGNPSADLRALMDFSNALQNLFQVYGGRLAE